MSDLAEQPPPCHAMCFWWDGEYEGECELPKGHDGDHYDGLSRFNDKNECTDSAHGVYGA